MSYSTQYCPAFVGSLTSGTSFGANTVGRVGWRLSSDGLAGGGDCVAGEVDGIVPLEEGPVGIGLGVTGASPLGPGGLMFELSCDRHGSTVNRSENAKAVDRRIQFFSARII
jgi:hypothetical protein